MRRSVMAPRLGSLLAAVLVTATGVVVASPVFDGQASILTDADDQTETPSLVDALPDLVPLPGNFASALNPDTVTGGGGGGGGSSRPGVALPGVPASLAGADRVATAIAVADADFRAIGSSSTARVSKTIAQAAVLVSATSFPDALTAGPLAFEKVAPLLLTARDGLDSRVASALTRLVPRGSTVYVVGGEAAIGSAVESQIEELGFVVTRLAGPDRYETALVVARDGLGSPATVFVATGLVFPDALAASAVAARRDGAVLLTRGEAVPTGVISYLRATDGIVVHAVGGPAARGLTASGITATAHQGADRYATATALAAAFAPTLGLVGVASGVSFPDGLVAAPYLARRNSVLVLVSATGVPTPTSDYLRNASGVTTVQVFGGLSVVSDVTRRVLSNLL
jgi:putative cell wall-binding protein